MKSLVVFLCVATLLVLSLALPALASEDDLNIRTIDAPTVDVNVQAGNDPGPYPESGTTGTGGGATVVGEDWFAGGFGGNFADQEAYFGEPMPFGGGIVCGRGVQDPNGGCLGSPPQPVEPRLKN